MGAGGDPGNDVWPPLEYTTHFLGACSISLTTGRKLGSVSGLSGVNWVQSLHQIRAK